MTRRTKVSIGDQGIPLEANRLFEGLSPQERERAIASCVRKRFARGERVFSTGDRPEFLYLLEVGHVQLVALEESGAERILHVFRPGDVFGEILLSVERRPFDAVAVDEAWVAIMSRATFLELLHTSPLCGLNFIRLISDRLFTAERDLAALSRTWTRPRLVHLLLKLADNLGQPTPQGTLITVPVTHETMASMIGASRVRVTSYLNLLRRDGLLSKQGRLMVIRTEGLKGWLGRKGD
ncbi:MAG: Crp/Fnr family transcriptional regulator [candidate division NC10 bacterium]|nr:Crp/Fnr family transcriptional regulator [candidate division NC10 bacterium]